MKLESTVREVKASGPRLTVRLRAESLHDESIYSTITHEIELPDSATARKTYFVGRPVSIIINPK